MLKKLKKNKKGFTLAELLIVVAIIGVLVAISIPIFTSQLEKAREATDEANLRALYAEAASALLTEDTSAKADDIKGAELTVEKGANDIYTATAVLTLSQQKDGLEAGVKSVNIAGVDVDSTLFGPEKKIQIVLKSDGTAPSITAVA